MESSVVDCAPILSPLPQISDSVVTNQIVIEAHEQTSPATRSGLLQLGVLTISQGTQRFINEGLRCERFESEHD